MGNFPSFLACIPKKHLCWQKRDANVRFRAVKVVLLGLFYNGAFSLIDSFRFRPVQYSRRWTKQCDCELFGSNLDLFIMREVASNS